MGSYDYIGQEPMLEMFLFETLQLIEQLEDMLIEIEKSNSLSSGNINEIFRIMHTIKGSSAMMMFSGISSLAHSLEDLFSQIRERKGRNPDCARLTDIVLRSVDFIKGQMAKIQSGENTDERAEVLITAIGDYMRQVTEPDGVLPTEGTGEKERKPEENKYYISNYRLSGKIKKYMVRIFFHNDCQMENIRAYTIIHNLREITSEIYYEPQDIIENDKSADFIRQNGFTAYFGSTEPKSEINEILNQTLFLEKLELRDIDEFPDEIRRIRQTAKIELAATAAEYPLQGEACENEGDIRQTVLKQQNIISVNLNRLDKLMDLVGEIVISEAMVTRNPDLDGITPDSFNKSARQLRKLTGELQDIVMSIRMLPVAATFHKMQRVVRDMNRKLGKDVELVLSGEETEVDKNIIDHLSDPLMHLIRNAIDHGVESREERLESGKPEKGTITLEAKNAGGDVWITVKDDGKGLNRDSILRKAREHGLLTRPETDYSEKEIFSFILLPGFSTRDTVSEFSGRGVGMDVVRENIEKLGGTILTDSVPGHGTAISVKIPLTLAIIDGMLIAVGKSRYIIPTTAIIESFRADEKQVIEDTEGNELIMLRGECYPVIRIHNKFNVHTEVLKLTEGIIVVAEDNSQKVCLFADELIGEQQVVVKPIPSYIKKSKGLAGCTILGDGSISLIMNISGILGI